MNEPIQHAVVWAEIPVTDMDRSKSFYETVLGCEMRLEESGPNPILMFPTNDEIGGVAGHIYPGKPSPGAGPTVHFAVPDTVEAASERVKEAGGTTLPGIIDIPAGRFGYAVDPDGNSIGLFQLTA